jgi:hypothetical protein
VEAIRSGRVVDIAGIPVLLSATDDRHAAAVASVLGALYDVPGEEPMCRITARPEPLPAPAGPPDEVHPDLEVWYGANGHGLQLRHRSGVCAAAEGAVGVIGGVPEPARGGARATDASELAVAMRRLLTPVSTALLAHHDRFVIHAAGVVRDDGAIVVLGPSGSGKSTIAAAGLDAGLRVLADDLLVLAPGRADGATPLVTGIRRPMAIPADVVPAGLETVAHAIGDPRGRVELGAEHLYPGCEPVVAVVLLARSATARGSATRADAPTVLHHVLDAFAGVQLPDLLRRFAPHAIALSRRPGWRLELSSDPANRLSRAARALGAVPPGARTDRG